jgi:F0F1-type ATP synthase beta subunit
MADHKPSHPDYMENMIPQIKEMIDQQNLKMTRSFTELKADIIHLKHYVDHLESAMNSRFDEMEQHLFTLGTMLNDVHSILIRMAGHQFETQERVLKLEAGN